MATKRKPPTKKRTTSTKATKSKKRKKPVVKVSKSAAPRTTPVPENTEWVEVTISLSREQIADLKAAGVNTTKLKITTFDISSLRGNVSN